MDPWTVLGVARSSTAAELKQAWRRAARRTHPDLGGDEAAFKAVQTAWDTLNRPPLDDGPKPWTHARAVRHLAERPELDVLPGGMGNSDDGDDYFTAFAGPSGEVVWLSDDELECYDVPIAWDIVDDAIMADVVDVLLGRA